MRRIPTICQFLRDLIRAAFDPGHGLVVEDNHLTSYRDGTAGERQQSHRHVALPEVTDEVDFTEDCERLHAWF